jgi:hypothetical protein
MCIYLWNCLDISYVTHPPETHISITTSEAHTKWNCTCLHTVTLLLLMMRTDQSLMDSSNVYTAKFFIPILPAWKNVSEINSQFITNDKGQHSRGMWFFLVCYHKTASGFFRKAGSNVLDYKPSYPTQKNLLPGASYCVGSCPWSCYKLHQMEQSSCERQMSEQFVGIAVGVCDFKLQILTNRTKILIGPVFT